MSQKKNLGFIIGSFVVILILIFIFLPNRKSDFTLSESKTVCFLRNLSYHEGKDLTYIKATLAPDGSTYGTMNMLYLDEYKHSGDFFGRWEGDGTEFFLDVLQEYSQRSELIREERVIKFNNESAFLGEGPTFEKEGVILFEDPKNLDFYHELLPYACEDIPLYASDNF